MESARARGPGTFAESGGRISGSRYRRRDGDACGRTGALFEYIPRLADPRSRRAGILSGREQQMLAIARGLICGHSALAREPSAGSRPYHQDLSGSSVDASEDGTTVLLV